MVKSILAGDVNSIRIDGTALLMVCLCDHGRPIVGPGTFISEVCDTHNALTLKSLCEAGYGTLLHVQDKSGKVAPVTVAMLRGE